MTKSTITITDDGKHIRIEVDHNPIPKGPPDQDGWSKPARIAEVMMRLFREQTDEAGIQPLIEAKKNWDTGDIDVTRRDEPKDGP